jgi:beta-lactamase superfamily II metal-dependent hydrolase
VPSKKYKEEAMIFSLDVRRAQQGDCLIIHYGTEKEPGLMLIDGGPTQVYKPQLKPRLAQIRQARGLQDEDSLPVDLLMVSHIDSDHIVGVLDLTRELVLAADSQQPLPLKVRSFWYNTFDEIIGNSPDELLTAVTASFGAAALKGEPDTEGLEPAAAKVLASVDQGLRLGDDARKLNRINPESFRLNPEFGGKLVMATGKAKGSKLGKGLKLTVAGPMKADLLELQKDYDDFLKKKEKKTKTPLSSFTDTTAPNLSSLVLLAEVNKKRILLTGDARGDKILEGLELTGMLAKNGTMHVDILKMPHHGSDRNMDDIFFRRITADHYVFSGNGEYGNPELETFKMLLRERGNDEFTIHLTYPIQEIDIEREKNWKEEQQKEKARKKKKPREDWSPEQHSLTKFFDAHEDLARKVSIVEANKPHVIDLLDNLGY